MEATRHTSLFLKVFRFLIALPVMAVCYLLGWVLMLVYSMGGAVMSMAAVVTAVGCVICLWQHSFRDAALAAVATWLFSPYGLPMVAMAAGSTALGIASFLYVWATK